MSFLFRFSGRIGRMQWLLGQLFVIFLIALGVFLITKTHSGSQVGAGYPASLLMFGLFATAIWINLALVVKRYHDRDKAWPWLFICLIPGIGSAWQFGECAFLPGSLGRNTYGHPPGSSNASFIDDRADFDTATDSGRTPMIGQGNSMTSI